MKILIAEDDLASRRFLSKFLTQYGEVDIVVDGLEALDAYLMAVKEKVPYDLICLDIMMSEMLKLNIRLLNNISTKIGLMLLIQNIF